MDKIGFAILGLDHWYAAFDIARQLNRHAGARLAAVSHPDPARLATFAAEFGAEFQTTDADAALARPGVDVVVTLASTEQNAARCMRAAAQGKHIISVKPLAMTLAEADGVVAAVRAARVHFMPLDTLWRLSAERRRWKAWLGEGRIGQPVRISHSMCSVLPLEWPDGPRNGGWWIDARRVPGGAWLDHAIYAIDWARWLLGSAPVKVSGCVSNMRFPELAVEDYGTATFTFANGAVAVIEDTWTSEPNNFLHRNELIGSAGAVLEDGGAWGNRVAVRGDFGHPGWTVVEPAREPAPTAVETMIAWLRGERAPDVTVEDGRENLRYCLAFYEAARAGRTVEV